MVALLVLASLVSVQAVADNKPPVISLDLANDRQCTAYPGCTTILTRAASSWRTNHAFHKESFKQEAAICHEREEWMVLLHGGEPGFVDKQCVNNDGEQTKTYAKRCDVLTSTSLTCPEPQAHVFDHHDRNVDDKLEIQRKLFVESLPRQAPRRANTIASSINYDLRSEYLLAFDAADTAGNQAETVQFAIVIQDHVVPVLHLHDTKGAADIPTDVESMGDFERFVSLPTPTAHDDYDGDVTDTITVTLDSGYGPKPFSGNLDTLLIGERLLTIKFNDFASIFGVNNVNNTVTKTFKIAIQDTKPPAVLCRTGGPVTCKLVKEQGELKTVCEGAVACPSDKAVGEHECRRDYHDIGAICIDAHDSSVFMPTLSLETSSEIPSLDTDVVLPKTAHDINAETAVYNSKHPVTYTCTDSQKNTATAVRTVHVKDRTPPNLDVTDDTESNLIMHLICGDPKNKEKLQKLQQLGVGYIATDDCTVAECSISLHFGNCAGEFHTHEGQLVNGGNSPAITDMVAVFNRGVASFHENQHKNWQQNNLAEEGTADDVKTSEIEGGVYGMKYTCKDSNDNVISKCRTIINEESPVCNPAPIACEVNSWAPWSACSRSCGEGQQTRVRSVKVNSQYGGQACPLLAETQPCNAQSCPIDCEVGEYGVWGECTQSCGGGLRYRQRAVTSPKHGGRECPPSTEEGVCNGHPCPVDCVFEWHPWDACDKSCGSGVQQRLPKISLWHAHGGSTCPDLQRRACNVHSCPVDCEVGTWGHWGKCTVSCGGGWQQRSRSITQPQFGGNECPVSAAEQKCNDNACPVDCAMEEWGVWTECSKSCSGGTQTRKRAVASEPAFGGKACLSQSASRACNTHSCPVSCGIGTWTAFGACSKSCGGGRQKRTRSLSAPEHGGESCPKPIQRRACNEQACPVNCEVGAWTGWGACSATCGVGSQQRTRQILGGAGFGGTVCPTLAQTQACNQHQCPVDCVAPFADWSACSVTCGPGTMRRERSVDRKPEFGGVACPTDMVQTIPCSEGECPQHCEVSSWSVWSDCTRTCGEGSQKRTRKVSQHADYGGYTCPALKETQSCNKQACPVDCTVNSWNAWRSCSKSCGGGTQVRFRKLVMPSFGGIACPARRQKLSCNLQPCPIDCTVGSWTSWAKCSKTCETGQTERTRKIKVEKQYGGAQCPPTYQMSSCHDQKCPIHCEMGMWTSWSSCSTSCGGGEEARSRSILTHSQHGGFRCPGTEDNRECNADPCPVDCALGPWSAWTACDVTCGGGTRGRARKVVKYPGHGGQACSITREEQSCHDESCPVDCVTTEWTKFSICSKSCGGGEKYRTRDIIVEPAHGGKRCGNTIRRRTCQLSPCPADCVVGTWQKWGDCDVSCSGGTQTRARANSPPLHAGKSCPHSSESRECNSQYCPKNCFVTTWSSWSECGRSCGAGYQSRTRAAVPPTFGGKECPHTKSERTCNTYDCPINCRVSKWSVWSVCSVTCGGGQEKRYRSVEIPVAFGGKQCPHTQVTRSCNKQACPPTPVHCEVASWSEWSACSQSCGTGAKTRTRTTTAPKHGGNACPISQESTTCNAVECPVNCAVSVWSTWSSCTHSCGTEGTTGRHRSVTVEHTNGGQICPSTAETKTCNVDPCPSDCVTGAWSSWSECSKSCGKGSRSRSRALTPPANGGSECPSLFLHTAACNQHACPQDCLAGGWSAYSGCSVTCGAGSKRRTRSLTAGGNGGRPCPAGEEFVPCSLTACPIDCEFGQWTEYSECSKSCNGGSQTRSRQVKISPAFGGKACPPVESSKTCGETACPVDCVLSAWSPWGACTKSCQTGVRSRTRTHTPPSYGGRHCAAVYKQTENCNSQACPVDCHAGAWSAWTDCSASCGGGRRVRHRQLTQPSVGGVSCSQYESTQTEACSTHGCPVDCIVSSWSAWNACSRSCGGGVKFRSRSVQRAAALHGRGCASLTQTGACNQQQCPQDCIVHSWGEWSVCTKSCTHEGTGKHGTQYRERTLVEGNFGGVQCPPSSETQECGHVLCPIHCEVDEWSAWSACTKSCGVGSQTRTRSVSVEAKHGGKTCPSQKHHEFCNAQSCPTDCVMSSWSSWTTCTVTCGGGTQSRARASSKAANGGKTCKPTSSAQVCNSHPCAQDCVVSPWSPFDDCSVSCGLGSKTRTRKVSAPAFGGVACPKANEVISCSWGICPVGCEVTTWSAWTACSVTCGGSTQSRTREILRRSRGGGTVCPHLLDDRVCGVMECPVDCEVGAWSSWTDCTKTCNFGSKQRTRFTKTAKWGGKACPTSLQIVKCASFECPVDCAVSTWTLWSKCSEPCGPGTTTRSRRTITPVQYGGKICPEVTAVEDCLVKHCPVDCQHTWEDWSECSVSCGTGQQSRSLKILVAAEHGGKACPYSQDRTCNTHVCPTPTPTTAPTPAPSSVPTKTPTATPTMSPTFRPKPIIDIVGGSIITVEANTVGAEYVDKGAWCSDLHDGDLNSEIVVSGDVIDQTKPSHIPKFVDYSCTANDGATAYARRTVYVADSTCPTCQVEGPKHTTVEASFPYKDDGASCEDSFDGSLTASYHTNLDVETVGTYLITYVAADAFGNANSGMNCVEGQEPRQHEHCCFGGKKTVRTVTVVDTLKPVIGLKYKGSSFITNAAPVESSTSTGAANPASDYFSRTSLMAESYTDQRFFAMFAAATATVGLAVFVNSRATSSDVRIDELV